MKRAWLEPFDWPAVVEINRRICLPKGALHKPTSDGFEQTRELWESQRRTAMTIAEAADLCRRCHRLAPFCNYNGNTFVGIIRRVVADLSLPPDRAAALRSLAGHIVAGTATSEEEKAFAALLDRIADEPGSEPANPM